MSFWDQFKRWRLAQQGLSSGKKRRVCCENLAARSLEYSAYVRWSLYLFYVGFVGWVLLVGGSDEKIATHIAIYGMVMAIASLVMFHVLYEGLCKKNSRLLLVLSGVITHMVVSWWLLRWNEPILGIKMGFAAMPFALIPILLGVLLGRSVGSYAAIYCSLLGSLIVDTPDRMPYLIFSLLAGSAAAMMTKQVKNRGNLLRMGLANGALVTLMMLFRVDWHSFSSHSWGMLGSVLGCTLVAGILTGFCINGSLPIFENLFKITTGISWLEMSDLNHKLLKQMQLEAPGTFQHSIQVASLAEAAAEAVGANAQMCRVCAYFHDIGKLKKPEYFTENQHDDCASPHDTLTPTMSALVIIAHVKDGIDMALKNRLNPRIIEVIQEHHGDSLVVYFHHKAQQQKLAELEKVERGLGNSEDLPKIDEKNFRYPGPRPRSIESAILSLADSIEGASRSLKKPTPAKIQSLVNDIIGKRIEDDQLSECELTLRDIKKIKESFCSTLRSMLHSRIEYPKIEKKEKSIEHQNFVG